MTFRQVDRTFGLCMYCMLVVERVVPDVGFFWEVAGASHRKAFFHFFTHFFAIFDDFSKFHNAFINELYFEISSNMAKIVDD